MASQSIPQDLPAPVMSLHDDQELCQYLLRNLDASATLEILPSKIHINGLSAKKAFPEGVEIFRSTPLVNCVGDGKRAIVCDYCYTSRASTINFEGNFRAEGDVMPTITLCKECRVCGYCSTNCQIKAWRAYHRFECEALIQSPPIFWMRMLYRVLAMHKHCPFSEIEWRALCHLWGQLEQNPLAIDIDTITANAMNAENLIQSGIDHDAIRYLLCKILTNIRGINHPRDGSLGGALDLLRSFTNHSCDPNAFVFFDGNQLRMRSIKPIEVGDEITESYVDMKAGVMMRRETLQSKYSFACNCNRCETEYAELQALSLSEGFSISDFAETEKIFINFKDQLISNNDNTSHEETVLNLTKTIFSTRPWPDSLYPMCEMKFHFAKVCTSSNNHHQAAIHALQGCLATITRSRPHWVGFMHVLLMYLRRLMAAPVTTGIDIPSPQNLRDFFNGLLHELLVQGSKIYGTDSRYTTALAMSYVDELSTMESPLPGEEGFAERFEAAQVNVLRWAGVDQSMAVVLSEGGTVMDCDGADGRGRGSKFVFLGYQVMIGRPRS